MFFKCDSGLFAQAVQIIERGVSQRSTLPVLGNILLEVGADSKLTLSSNSLDLGMQMEIPVKTMKPGKILAPAKMISGIAAKLPEGELSLEVNPNQHIRIEVGSSKFLVHGLAASDFPELMYPKQAAHMEFPSETLSSVIKQTIFAVSADESKPFLNGILFDISGSELRLVSTDGYRLALRSEAFTSSAPLKAIIPTRTLNELLKLVASFTSEETVLMELSGDLVLFKVANVLLISRLIQGQFPDYRLVIPSQSDTKITLSRKLFLDAAERCAIVASSSSNILNVELSGQQLLLSASSPEIGDANEIVAVEAAGSTKQRVAFNAKLLLDVLRNVPDGDVQLELSKKLSPGVLRPKGYEKNYLYIIMPIKTTEAVEVDPPSPAGYGETRREAVPA